MMPNGSRVTAGPAAAPSRVVSASPPSSTGVTGQRLGGVAGQGGEDGAVLVDHGVAGHPGILDGHRPAHPGVRGQRPVQGHGVVGIDPRGEPLVRDQKLAPSQLTGWPPAMIRAVFRCML
jgi:hypothetical protein